MSSGPAPSSADAARMALVDRIVGFTLSRGVHVAARLGIADLLAEGPRSAEDLAAEIGADPGSTYRLLRALSGYGIFAERPDGRFSNSEQSDLLREPSIRDLATVLGELFYPAFAELDRTVRTGEPAFDVAFGAAFDEHLAEHPPAGRRFQRFMAHGKTEVAAELARHELEDHETVVDVGGGSGALLHALLRRCPDLRGIVFDLPHNTVEAARRTVEAGLEDRCAVVTGSFFDAVPAGGDVYMLSRILHDWADEDAARILTQVHRAVRDHGRLLVLDGVVAPPNEPGERVMDLLMAAIGGRERTEDEWRNLLAATGFALEGIRPAAGTNVIRARPV